MIVSCVSSKFPTHISGNRLPPTPTVADVEFVQYTILPNIYALEEPVAREGNAIQHSFSRKYST